MSLRRSWAALQYFIFAETSLRFSPRASRSPLVLLFFGLGGEKVEKWQHHEHIVKHSGFGLKPVLESLLGGLGALSTTLFNAKPRLEIVLEPSWALLHYFFLAQVASRGPPRGLQEPKMAQDSSKRVPRQLQGPFWDPFWTNVGTILD